MKRVKTFEATDDGRYLFRPFGNLGSGCEIPDRRGFEGARYLSGGMVVPIFACAIANVFFHNLLVFMLAIVGIAAAYMIWLMIAKSGWKKLD